jgi:MFS family permease
MVVGGLLLATAAGFAQALAGRLVSGAGGALLTVVLSSMLMERFSGAALASAMGASLAAWPLGLGLGLLLLPAIAASWQAGMFIAAFLCAVALLSAALILAPPPRAAAARAMVPRKDGVVPNPLGLASGEAAPLFVAGLAYTAHNLAFAVLLGFAPALLAERGMSAAAAAAAVSLAGLVRIPLLPFTGALVERTGHPLLATMALHGVTAVAVVALAADLGPPAVALVAAGLLSTGPGPVIMSMPARVLAPERRALGMGYYYTIYYAGMAALPPLAGSVGDTTGSAAAPLLVVAGFSVATIAAVAVYGALIDRASDGEGLASRRGGVRMRAAKHGCATP